MATLTIGDKRVTVDDSFRNLSPADQQKTVDEIAAKIGVGGPSTQPTSSADNKTLERAFMNADAAGDTQAAQVLANEIKRRRGVSTSSQAGAPIHVKGPDGAIIQFPAGTDQAVMEKALQEHYAGWGKGGAAAVPWYTPITSAPGNAWDVAKGLYETVRHPIDTANSVASLGNGAIANIPGVTAINDWAVAHGLSPAYDKSREAQDQQLASTVGQQVKDNFRSPTEAWNTLATHPVDTLLTAAPVVGQVGKIADAVGLAKIASGLEKTAKFTNPVTIAGKSIAKGSELVGKGLSYPLAPLSGVSPEALQMAARAGQEGGDASVAFRSAMRGREAPEAIVNDAKTALGNLAEQRRANYLAGMRGTASSNAVVDTAPIRQALNDLRDSLYVTPKAELGDNAGSFSPLQKGSAGDIKTLDQIDQLLTQWEAHPEGRTPLAMDALKQRLDELQPAFGNPALDNQRRLVTRMQTAIKGQISGVEPSYSKAMADYSSSKSAQTEIEKSLGLGRNASADTALNRLKTVIGGNKANRAANAAELESHGAPNLMNRLAGLSLSQLEPKGGLAKLVAAALTGSSWWNPTHLVALPATSPRLVGELAHALGRTARGVETVAGHLPPGKRLAQILLGSQVLQGANGQ